MIVQGQEISQDVIDAAIAWMGRQTDGFEAYMLADEFERLGLSRSDFTAARCANRLMQREKIRGRIRFNGVRWYLQANRA